MLSVAFLDAIKLEGPCKVSALDILPIWVVVKIMVPFWVPNIIRHLLFRVPKKGP